MSHTASHAFSVPACFFYKIFGACKNGAYRATEPFGEAEHDRIGVVCNFLCRSFQGVGGVEDAGTVKVDVQSMFSGYVHEVAHCFYWGYGSSGAVVSVFQAEQGCFWGVDTSCGDSGFNLLGIQDAIYGRECPGEALRVDGRASRLIEDDMGVLFYEDGFSWFDPGTKRDLISHRSAWDEERSFFADDVCSEFFQFFDSGIIAEDIISQGGTCHTFVHFGGWFGHGIAS